MKTYYEFSNVLKGMYFSQPSQHKLLHRAEGWCIDSHSGNMWPLLGFRAYFSVPLSSAVILGLEDALLSVQCLLTKVVCLCALYHQHFLKTWNSNS